MHLQVNNLSSMFIGLLWQNWSILVIFHYFTLINHWTKQIIFYMFYISLSYFHFNKCVDSLALFFNLTRNPQSKQKESKKWKILKPMVQNYKSSLINILPKGPSNCIHTAIQSQLWLKVFLMSFLQMNIYFIRVDDSLR